MSDRTHSIQSADCIDPAFCFALAERREKRALWFGLRRERNYVNVTA